MSYVGTRKPPVSWQPEFESIVAARFFLVQRTKTGKNIPNYHKIYDMMIKYKNEDKIPI
jgi:hypothetical protein